jgi:hypothetical protein
VGGRRRAGDRVDPGDHLARRVPGAGGRAAGAQRPADPGTGGPGVSGPGPALDGDRRWTAREPETLALEPDDGIPNSRLPVLIYRGLALAEGPAAAESAFADHGWRGAWRNGIFGFHHFHSTAHEVLAIVAGSVHVRLGGRTLLTARSPRAGR